ncbi:hypothetical protein BGZ67_000836 [Mortierella alpina]|nr:hypothetical protein BGZ67_000836 [Mortierella alpina]
MVTPFRQVRANYDDKTITVYQAYNSAIASAAVAEQKLNASPKFLLTRMTWIKPSWAWMLYRAGYSYKDPGQERILALKMTHDSFINLLDRAVLTTHDREETMSTMKGEGSIALAEGTSNNTRKRAHRTAAGAEKSADVKVQWDPERTIRLDKLEHRSIQIGIPKAISSEWVENMIVKIEDVTDKARKLKQILDDRPDVTDEELIQLGLIPAEKPFELPERLKISLRMEGDLTHNSNMDTVSLVAGPNPKKRILIGATGSVASVKIPIIVKTLLEEMGNQVEVKVVATNPALHFFQPSDVAAEVLTDQHEWDAWGKMSDPVMHIEVRERVLYIAQSVSVRNANTLAKVAQGLCDNLITCILRAWDESRPVIVCPAMNTNMWNHKFTAMHLATLTGVLNYQVIQPISKLLACGDLGVEYRKLMLLLQFSGIGAMAEYRTIVDEIKRQVENMRMVDEPRAV